MIGPYQPGPIVRLNAEPFNAKPLPHFIDFSVAVGKRRYLVSWSQGLPDGGRQLHGQILDHKGVPVGSILSLNNGTTPAQNSIVATEFGFAAVWDSLPNHEIYLRLFTHDGQPKGEQVRVDVEARGMKCIPKAVPLPNQLFVAFGAADGSSRGIYGQRFSANSTERIGVNERLNTVVQHDQVLQGAARIPGGLALVWRDSINDGSSFGVVGRTLDHTGAAASDEFQLNTYRTGEQATPTVTDLPDGFATFWHSQGQDGHEHGIYGQRFDEKGGRIGSEFRANTYRFGNQWNPRSATLLDSIVVTWSSNHENPDDDLYARLFTSTAEPIGPEVRVNEVTTGSQYGDVAAHNDGLFIAWQTPAANGTGLDLVGRAYTLPQSSTTMTSPMTTTVVTTSTSLRATTTSMTLLTHTSATGTMTLFASSSAPTVPILVGVVILLALSLGITVGLYFHQRQRQKINKEVETTEGESSQYGNLTLTRKQEENSRYQAPPALQRKRTEADYDSWSVVEEENAKY